MKLKKYNANVKPSSFIIKGCENKMKFPSTWTSAEMEVADAYGDTLSSLRMNSKPIINTLTELANGYSKEHPKIIVYLIEERIKEVITF